MGVSLNRTEPNAALQPLEQDVALAARSQARVLITGEEGVGKADLARRIHESGRRAAHCFETVRCAGVPDWVLAAQLFGQVGADGARRIGAFERADGGTLFLDGIDGLSAGIQARLLRYIDDGEVQPIGADRPLRALDVRLIVSTALPLATRVASGRFGQDLFYRLNVIHLVVPPLRHQGEDLVDLLACRMRQTAGRARRQAPELSAEAAERVVRYRWPGNVRELHQVADRLVQCCVGRRIEVADLPSEVAGRAVVTRSLNLRRTRRLVLRARDFTGEALSCSLERVRAH